MNIRYCRRRRIVINPSKQAVARHRAQQMPPSPGAHSGCTVRSSHLACEGCDCLTAARYTTANRSLTDARARLDRYARHLVQVHVRQAQVMLALAAAADPDAAAIWRKHLDDRRPGMAMFAADRAATGELRPDHTIDTDQKWSPVRGTQRTALPDGAQTTASTRIQGTRLRRRRSG